MDKRPLIFILALAVLAVLGVFAYQSLEIYPRTRRVFPSREAAANEYLALERWLAETGHPVRAAKIAELSRLTAAPEKVIAVNSRSADWSDTSPLLPWISSGGFLLILLDGINEELAAFLSSFGILIDIDAAGNDAENPDETENKNDEPQADTWSRIAPAPDFDQDIRLVLADPVLPGVASLAALRDERGVIRLARAVLGNGGIAVTGRPRFMGNDYLDREINARLSWELTAAKTLADNPGILFIREKKAGRGLLGKIAGRGNVLPLGIALALLIITGFWMTVPVFGLVFSEAQTASRPVRERFAAETRFLKKYGGLESYLETYLREIKLRQGGIQNQYIEEIEQALVTKRRLSTRDCTRALKKLAVHWSEYDGTGNTRS